MIAVTCAVEGMTDEPVVRRLMSEAGLTVGPFVRSGQAKSGIDKDLPRWNESAARIPWFVLRDLDHDDGSVCIPELRFSLLGNTAAREGMCFRLAVRAVEAWLLADYEGFKRYFKVGTRLRVDVDRLEDPKTELVNFCRRSNSRDVKSGVPPQPGSGRRVGPEYVAIVGEYCREVWNPDRARHRSPSLDRAMTDIDRLGGWIRGLEPVS